MASPWSILGLAISSSLEDARRQYKRLALPYHPDKNPNQVETATQNMVALHAAYESVVKQIEARLSTSNGFPGSTSAQDHCNNFAAYTSTHWTRTEQPAPKPPQVPKRNYTDPFARVNADINVNINANFDANRRPTPQPVPFHLSYDSMMRLNQQYLGSASLASTKAHAFVGRYAFDFKSRWSHVEVLNTRIQPKIFFLVSYAQNVERWLINRFASTGRQ